MPPVLIIPWLFVSNVLLYGTLAVAPNIADSSHQAEEPIVPQAGWFAGLGGSFNSVGTKRTSGRRLGL